MNEITKKGVIKMTIRERIIKMLESKGYVKVTSRSKKYVVMFKNGISKRTNEPVDVFYFIGSRGSVKLNNRNVVDGARTMTDTFQLRLKHFENNINDGCGDKNE